MILVLLRQLLTLLTSKVVRISDVLSDNIMALDHQLLPVEEGGQNLVSQLFDFGHDRLEGTFQSESQGLMMVRLYFKCNSITCLIT